MVFVAGYPLMNSGFTLVNTSEDHSEDAAEGIRTWAHLFGLKTTLIIAFLFAVGGFLSVLALGFRFAAMGLSFDLKDITTFLLIGILSSAIVLSAIEVHNIGIADDVEESAKR